MATQQIAQGLAGLGRYGDSTLVHMQPEEVAGLQALAKTQGTSLTINPETGLPEAFNLGGFFRSLAPTLAGLGVAMIPGMQPYALQAGIAAGALTGAALNKKDPLMGAVMGGIGGYGGQGLAGAAGSFGKQAAAAGVDPQIAAVQSGFNAIPTNVGANMANPSAAITDAAGKTVGVNMGATNMVKPVTYNTAATGFGSYSPHLEGAIRPDLIPEVVEPSALSKAASGFADNASNAFSNVAQDPLKFIGQNKMAVGMPLAGGILGGLEPSDLGYNPMKPDGRDKYDPYSTLNLGGDTGLRLYAQGGPVSFADGGDALKGGGEDAMKGSGLLPLDVSDINARYGYDPEARSSSGMGNNFMGSSNTYGSSMPSVQAPMLGLFAENDQIEAARTAYEQQLAAAMSGRGGMGSVPNARQVSGLSSLSGVPQQSGMGLTSYTKDIGSMGSTAPTASTAETALARLNLNKTYAEGGTIQGGGLQDLYGSSDNVAPPQLSQNGYGLGRLQAMAQGGEMGYARGGHLQSNNRNSGRDLSVGRSQNNQRVRNTPVVNPAPTRQFNTPADLGGVTAAPVNQNPMRGWSSMFRGLNFPVKNNEATAPSDVYANVGASNLTNNPTNPNLYTPNIANTNNFVGNPSLYTNDTSNLYSNTMGYAVGGEIGYADGGETRYTLDKNSLGGKMFGETGVIDQLPPSALAEILNNPGMRQFMGFRGVEEPKYYTASGMGGGSGALSTVGPRVNLNTASGVGYAKGGYLDGPGDGMSDSIPATIEGKQPARLADGEFVIPADVVSHLGNGSTKAGSKRLYAMLDKVRHARTGNKKQGKQIKPEKYMPA